MMTEFWNPFDDGNPVYKELAKKTAVNRQSWRIVGSIAALFVLADQAGNSQSFSRRTLRKIPIVKNFAGYRNPYGIIRR